MLKNDVRKVLRARLLEYHGYRNKQIKILNYKRQVVGNLFSIMPVIVMTIFVVIAFIIGITYIKYKGTMDADGSGLEYAGVGTAFETLKKDTHFLPAVKNTFIYTGVVAAFSIAWSLVMASMISLTKIRGKKLFIIGFFLPQVTSDIAATIIFSTMMKNGLHVQDHAQNWFWIMAIIGMWGMTASSFVIFNTAFANIGKTEYEAASLDGANALTKFLRITIPALAPIIAYQLMMSIIYGMTAFGASYSMITLGYVNGADKDFVLLWPVLGFLRAKGGADVGIKGNVGVGFLELIILGVVLASLTLVSNRIQPIQGRK